jgi:hypothetical protein
MKKTILLIVVAAFGLGPIIAQNNCSRYYPLDEGSSFQYTLYNKKGKEDGTTEYSVSNVKDEGGETTATFKMSFTDSKGKNNFSSEYDIVCTGEGIKIDHMSILPTQMISQYEDMDLEMDISGTDIELPNDLSVGQQLADANVSCKMSMSGIKMNISVDQIDRKVEKQETITTPAGTFDCYVLSETTKSKTMGANIEIYSKTWLAEGIGMIKNEVYKKNGDLQSRSELTGYNK